MCHGLSAASAFLVMFFAYFNIYYGLCFWYLAKMNYCRLLLCILCSLTYVLLTIIIIKKIHRPSAAHWMNASWTNDRGYAKYYAGRNCWYVWIFSTYTSHPLSPCIPTTVSTHPAFTIPFDNSVWKRKREIKNIQSTCAAPDRLHTTQFAHAK